jgi:hypothetical protein
MERPRQDRGRQKIRFAGARLFGGVAGRYRAIKRRLADMLMRGDRDYAMVSALSQEIGRIHQKIRADLEHRQEERRLRRGASKGKRPSRPPGTDGRAP